MIRKLFLITLAVVLITGLVLSGCAKTAPGEIIQLKASTWEPLTGPSGIMLTRWIEEVEKRTDGRVKIDLYASETLAKQKEHYQVLQAGATDIAWMFPSHYPGTFPLCDFAGLYFVIPRHTVELANQLYDKYIYKEFEGQVKMLLFDFAATAQLHSSKKPIRTLEDIKGMQIRCSPGMHADQLKALGATPVTIPSPELYTALDRGMVDGCIFPFRALEGFKIHEVTKYHTVIDLCSSINVLAMNLNTWNSLPPDIQKTFDEITPWLQKMNREVADQETEAGISTCKEAGNTFIEISPEEKAKWAAAVKPVIDSWSAEMDTKGLPGTALINEARNL